MFNPQICTDLRLVYVCEREREKKMKKRINKLMKKYSFKIDVLKKIFEKIFRYSVHGCYSLEYKVDRFYDILFY